MTGRPFALCILTKPKRGHAPPIRSGLAPDGCVLAYYTQWASQLPFPSALPASGGQSRGERFDSRVPADRRAADQELPAKGFNGRARLLPSLALVRQEPLPPGIINGAARLSTPKKGWWGTVPRPTWKARSQNGTRLASMHFSQTAICRTNLSEGLAQPHLMPMH